MEQHRSGGRHKGRGCPELGQLFPRGRQKSPQFSQGKPGPRNLPKGQAGIGIDQTGREPRPHIGVRQIGLRLLCRCPSLSAEIVVLRQRNVSLWAGRHGLHRFQAVSRLEGGVHQRHQTRVIQKAAYKACCALRSLALELAGVLGLLRIGRNSPGLSKFLRARNAPLHTELLDHSVREVPLFGGFLHGEVFHTLIPPSFF